MKAMIILIFLVFSYSASANEYGYIKYEVDRYEGSKSDRKHFSKVRLFMNTKVAEFSHAFEKNPKNPWSYFQLSRSNLAEGGQSEIKASYKTLVDGCEFNIHLYHSFDSRGPWVHLGSIHAPHTRKPVKLDIGLCEGRLCSSDPSINKKIQDNSTKKAIQKYNLWKKEYDRRQSEYLSEVAQLKRQRGDGVAVEVLVGGQEGSLTESVKRQIFDEFLSWKPEGHPNPEYEFNQEEEIALVEEESRRQESAQFEEQLAESNSAFNEKPGVVQSLEQDLRQNIERLESTTLGLESIDSLQASFERDQLENLKMLRENVVELGVLKKPLKEGMRFLPFIGDGVDFCEAVTARENCDKNGRKLEDIERVVSAAALFIGTRKALAKYLETLGVLSKRQIAKAKEISVLGKQIGINTAQRIGVKTREGLTKLGMALTSKRVSPFDLNPTHRLTMGKQTYQAFKERLKQDGIVRETIKYVEYNGQKYIVDGHHRARAAKELGFKEVPIEKVELPYKGYDNIDDVLMGGG